jgi:hypothetical protein
VGSSINRGASAVRSLPARYLAAGAGLLAHSSGENPFEAKPVPLPGLKTGSPAGKVQGPLYPFPGFQQGGGTAFPMVSPVAINYTPGAAPAFNKTLKDYLADKQLQGLVNMQIFQTNKPLLDANKTEVTKRNRASSTNKAVGSSIQKQYAKKMEDMAADHAASAARAQVRQDMLQQQTAEAQASVPVTYLEGEAAKAKSDSQVSMANEQSLADSLIDRLATESQQYLDQLKGAEASQTQVDEQHIQNTAADNIRANVNQIRANQSQRGTLLGTLAAEQYKNAIDLHNMDVDSYNKGEDRKYQQASDAAQIAYNASRDNAANETALIGAAAGDSGSAAKYTPAQKRGTARLQALQLALDKARTTEVKLPGEGGKMGIDQQRIKRITHEMARIKKKYKL